MKGQSQVVTAVLLTGIMIVLVSSVYLWGVPLIQKQKDTVTLNNMETFMKDLNDKIQKVAANGGREKIENVNLPGDLRITDNDINDFINLTFETTGQLIATNSTIYLAGDKEGFVPINKPAGTIEVASQQINDEYRIDMSLWYREVVSGTQSNKIDLEIGGRTLVGAGRHDVLISESSAETRTGKGAEGRDLFITKVSIRFE